MQDRFRELIKPRHHAVIAVLTLAFFAFMTVVLRPFVPAFSETWIWAGAAYTAAILAGVFWIAAYMFTLVLSDERQRAAARR